MKSKQKAMKTLLVLGIIFAISTISTINLTLSTHNLSNYQENIDNKVEIRDEISEKRPKNSGSWTETFIHIDGSIPNNWSLTNSTYDWCYFEDGYYIIENVTVDATGRDSGIFINNSKNILFKIRNCTVYNAGRGGGYSGYDGGIKLENTCNGTIIGNNVSNNINNGICLSVGCRNNTITKNNGTGNLDSGLRLQDDCDFNIITKNNFSYSDAAVGNDGIQIESGCDNNTIANNTVNNNKRYGIVLYDYCDNNTISGNTANYNVQYGIYLYYCDNNTISGNTANNNLLDGIFLDDYCDNNTISENSANDNGENGIETVSTCDNNIISGNTASNTNTNDQNFGMVIGGDNNKILGNIINNNLQDGIVIGHDDNEITGNYLYFNDWYGIELVFSADNNIVERNIIVRGGDFMNDDGTLNTFDLNLKLTSAPSICVEVVNQSFSTTEFVIYIKISSGFDIFYDWDIDFNIDSMQMWWNGEDVPSNDIEKLGIGLYKVSLTPELVAPGEDPILFNMTVTAKYYGDKYFEMELAVEAEVSKLCMDIVDQFYSDNYFNMTFYVFDASDPTQGIEGAVWSLNWNGTDVSGDIVPIGDGNYSISLIPITVEPGEDHIILMGNITALGFDQKDFEIFITVDPETVDKTKPQPQPSPQPGIGDDDDDDGKPEENLLLVVGLISAISAIGAVSVISAILIKRRLKIKR